MNKFYLLVVVGLLMLQTMAFKMRQTEAETTSDLPTEAEPPVAEADGVNEEEMQNGEETTGEQECTCPGGKHSEII